MLVDATVERISELSRGQVSPTSAAVSATSDKKLASERSSTVISGRDKQFSSTSRQPLTFAIKRCPQPRMVLQEAGADQLAMV
jgi:hypothetical protein